MIIYPSFFILCTKFSAYMACTEKSRALNVKKVNPQRELITRYGLNGTFVRTLSFVVTRFNEAPVGVAFLKTTLAFHPIQNDS